VRASESSYGPGLGLRGGTEECARVLPVELVAVRGLLCLAEAEPVVLGLVEGECVGAALRVEVERGLVRLAGLTGGTVSIARHEPDDFVSHVWMTPPASGMAA
jgi:hypothetical protein